MRRLVGNKAEHLRFVDGRGERKEMNSNENDVVSATENRVEQHEDGEATQIPKR